MYNLISGTIKFIKKHVQASFMYHLEAVEEEILGNFAYTKFLKSMIILHMGSRYIINSYMHGRIEKCCTAFSTVWAKQYVISWICKNNITSYYSYYFVLNLVLTLTVILIIKYCSSISSWENFSQPNNYTCIKNSMPPKALPSLCA